MDSIIGGLKWLVIFMFSLFWVYMAARMIGRAVQKTLTEMFHKNQINGGSKNGKEEEQIKTEETE